MSHHQDVVIVRFSSKLTSKKTEDPLKDWTEVSYEDLKFLTGTWIKWKKLGHPLQTGILSKWSKKGIEIRQLKSKDRIEISDQLQMYTWFCKKDSEHHHAIVAINTEWQKIELSRKQSRQK